MMHMTQLHQVLVSCMFVHIDEFAFASCVLNTVCLGKLCPNVQAGYAGKRRTNIAYFLLNCIFLVTVKEDHHTSAVA